MKNMLLSSGTVPFRINLTGSVLTLAEQDGLKIRPNGCIVVPKQCPNENITFFLYTRSTVDRPYQLDVKDPNSIKNAAFIPFMPIKFLIHGYTGDRNYSPNMELRPAYFKRQNVNIISIDYKPLVPEPCYIEAVENVPVVANCSAMLIEQILKHRSDIELKQFHIIGLSLGAQVAGFIPQFFKMGLFDRITGLDPALPLFFNFGQQPTTMLNRNAAKFVDVVHTNAGIKGKLSPIADVDFYANFGTFQPGCGYNTSCSHVRAADYYAESITTEVGFLSAPCSNLFLYFFGECKQSSEDDLVAMGEYVPRSASGIYMFKTSGQSPFALGTKPYKHSYPSWSVQNYDKYNSGGKIMQKT